MNLIISESCNQCSSEMDSKLIVFSFLLYLVSHVGLCVCTVLFGFSYTLITTNTRSIARSELMRAAHAAVGSRTKKSRPSSLIVWELTPRHIQSLFWYNVSFIIELRNSKALKAALTSPLYRGEKQAVYDTTIQNLVLRFLFFFVCLFIFSDILFSLYYHTRAHIVRGRHKKKRRITIVPAQTQCGRYTNQTSHALSQYGS